MGDSGHVLYLVGAEISCSLLRSLSLCVVIGSSLKHTQINLLLTHLLQQSGQRRPYSDCDTGWAAKGLWFDSRQRQELLIFSKSPIPAGLPIKEATFNSKLPIAASFIHILRLTLAHLGCWCSSRIEFDFDSNISEGTT